MFEFIVSTHAVDGEAAVAVAGTRAGATGVVDLQFAADPGRVGDAVRRVSQHSHGPWGVHVDAVGMLETVLAAEPEGLETVLVSAPTLDELATLIARARATQRRTLAVVTSVAEALAAQEAGADAVVAKGSEAGGWVGEEGAFILLQRLVATLAVPVYVQGGIGRHTVVAAYVGGAAGAVLDGQLLLTRESPLAPDARTAVAGMDGSETVLLGERHGQAIRVYGRPGSARVSELSDAADRADSVAAWRAAARDVIAGAATADGLPPIGQDAALAADLGARFETVAGVVSALRSAIADATASLADGQNPLAPDGPLARSHGTRYPIVQGPMTRVSDTAEFAAAVSEAGALPFLALALMREPEADALLKRTRELSDGRPWGVGVLGFVPPELRAEQLAVVRRHRPPFALIAGGRPDQAKELEDEGIATYLHVPSPGLLKLYLAQGARRFVFEGRECGGHVGPRTSFVLWESMLQVLLDELPAGQTDCHVLFAGGIHDARSAAMVAAAANAASERGIQIGVLIGTAYLFTREAVQAGAITETFQRASVAAAETVTLESGPGHATRCLPSPFAEHFLAEKQRLRDEGVDAEALRQRLEELNIGRLRIASKGTERNPAFATDPTAPKLTEIDRDRQWDEGMYMIGQVATMRDEVITLAELHADVSTASGELLDALVAIDAIEDAAPPPPADIAIIGMACILPGAPDARTLWSNILGKVDAITEIPARRWDWRVMYDPDPTTPDKVYSRWGGFIDPVPFSPIEIGMPPKSVASIEPFQLLALITAQAALGDAGYATRPFDRERTSVILGAGGGGADLSVGYTVRSAFPSLIDDPALQKQVFDRLPEWTEDSFAGILMNVAAGRIANRLDFGGTNFTVDAACASSLAATGMAVKELRLGSSDLALAGGVDAIQNPFAFLCFAKTHALSPTGHCRPFDADADGIAISEGFATVVLKRLADAERDGDRIYAVIRGVGAASDGRDRSLTAPRPEGQMRALRRAYAQAGYSPATVGLVEAHGTGTVAGDGAEVTALTTIFDEFGTGRQTCAIGSIKSMIGHTKATAGVAGVIKAALALHHRVLPPTIGVTEPNPKANFPESPFYVNTEARPWLASPDGHPRRASVSAFGFGGTDFHIALEEYTGGYLPAAEATVERWPGELLLWRGTPDEITDSLASLAAQLDAGAAPELADLALTLGLAAPEPAVDRAALALVVESLDDLRTKLAAARALLAGEPARLHAPHGIHYAPTPLAADGGVAFLFPGQGSQKVDMGRELALAFPEAHEAFELADRILAGRYEQPLSRYLFPPPTFTEEDASARRDELTDTHVAQAALGATELAYLRVLNELGVEPDMTAGHSYGEFVALAAAGGLDAEQLLVLSEARGRHMADAAAGEAGAMAAVEASAATLAPLLDEGNVVAANLNGPNQTVISGPSQAIEQAVAWCAERDLRARVLPVSCAFHSPQVAGARRRFSAELKRATISSPRIPVYSNTTGKPHASDPDTIAQVLRRHIVKPVRFTDEIEAMHEAGARVFVEVGPRSVLTGLTGQILAEREHVAVAVDRAGRSSLLSLLQGLAVLATEGVPVRVDRLLRGRPAKRVNLTRLTAAASPPPPGQWLVDGGRARPAAEPVQPSPSPITPPQEQPAVTSTTHNGTGPPTPVAAAQPPASHENGNGNGNGHVVPSPATGWIEAAPQPVASPAPAPPAGDRVADVMLHYHQVMQQFLDTERSVMLGYLGAARQDPGSRSTAPLSSRVTLAPLAASTPMPQLAAPAPATAPVPAAPAFAAAPVPAPPAVAAAPVPAAAAPAPATAAAVLAPAAAVLAPAPPVAAAAPAVVLTHEEIEARLLDVVCERTGYPTDMLSLDADLEGDLGIDSIKRVEIAGTFTQTLAEEQRAAIDMELLTSSRTLREVIAVLEEGIRPTAPGPPEPNAPPPAAAAEAIAPFESRPAETERIGRFVVHPMSAPTITATAGLHPAGVIAIIDDGSGVPAQLATQLAGRDETVLIARASSTGEVRSTGELVEQLRQQPRPTSALVFPADDDGSGGVATLLTLVQELASDLQFAADGGGAAVIGVTRLGGAFGLDGADTCDTGDTGDTGGQRALSGFLKTLAVEWPAIRVRTVDLAPTADPELAASQLAAELYAADDLVEVGYRDGERTTLVVSPVPLGEAVGSQPIDGDCVVVVTGGARGITAAAALELARRHRPTLVLVGRTPLGEEPAETTGITDHAELRRTLIAARRRDGAELAPALVEADLRRLLAQREVADNLAALRAIGAQVDYRRCDVGDPDAFGALIDDVYASHSRIDGVIHGAGVIEDRLIADKSPESLERVFAVKAGAALTLARRLRPESLRFLVLFSSVSGRFGNRGQADYAAASEVLAQLANTLDRSWPGRVVAIDWGPWSGTGMVSEALEREFERRGVALIDIEAGSRILADELASGRAGEAELVIGAASGLSESAPTDGAPTAAPLAPSSPAVARLPLLARATTTGRDPAGTITFVRELDLDHDRYLRDHRVDGQPVFPFAAAMELMAEGAIAATPGQSLAGLQGIRLLKGIVVPDGGRFAVRVSTKPLPTAGEVEVTIGAADGSRLHYRSVARLHGPEATPAAPAGPVALPELPAFPLPLRDAYRDLLFHGPIFQGIGAIAGMDGRGATAQLHPSVPADCMSDSEGLSWELDPVMLDSALQAQVLWARLQWDVTLLPAEIVGYERFDAPRPGESVHHELRIQGQSAPPMCHADHWFFGADGRLLATLTGVVGVGTRALNRLAATRV